MDHLLNPVAAYTLLLNKNNLEHPGLYIDEGATLHASRRYECGRIRQLYDAIKKLGHKPMQRPSSGRLLGFLTRFLGRSAIRRSVGRANLRGRKLAYGSADPQRPEPNRASQVIHSFVRRQTKKLFLILVSTSQAVLGAGRTRRDRAED